jgi:hypothetical protein
MRALKTCEVSWHHDYVNGHRKREAIGPAKRLAAAVMDNWTRA